MTDSIQKELVQIKGNKQLLTAEAVVSWAESHPDSALHNSFEWDDAAAGTGYRLWQARRLIALNVVGASNTRRFISLTIDQQKQGGGYRDIQDVMNTPKLRDILLSDALHEFQRIARRYENLEEFAKVNAAIKQVAKLVEPVEDEAAA